MFSHAASFYVTNVTEFQSALTAAESNGEHDTITAATGNYNVTSTLTYNPGENYSLLINGSGMTSTTMDGGDASQVLRLHSYGNDAHFFVRNMGFQNGLSISNGGGLHVETDGADIVIDSCEFNDNYADTMGGGATAVSNTGDITIADCFFRRNVGYFNAGGLNAATTSGEVLLYHSYFEYDSVYELIDSSSHVGGDGGGALLYAEESQITMRRNTFMSNYAADDGGGGFAYMLATNVIAVVDSNLFMNNHAQLNGGGNFVRLNGGGTIEYHDNVHSSNTTAIAEGAGAFLYLNQGDMACSNNAFENNASASDGGGLMVWQGTGTMEWTWNRFAQNNAANNGGGAGVVMDAGTITFSRNLLFSNTTGNVGGGLSYATTSAALTLGHNTLYGNTAADGGGIYFYFDDNTATSEVVNSIMWQDTPNGIAYSGAISMAATYSDIENGTGEPWFGNGCIDEDPLFVNPAGNDYRLSWENWPNPDSTMSPCIDAGDPSWPEDPDSTRADMGVYYYDQITGIDEHRQGNVIRPILWAYPNPFHEKLNIVYCVERKAYSTTIDIYDATGRLVRSFAVPGSYFLVPGIVTWDGYDNSGYRVGYGIYLITYVAGNQRETRKVVFIK
jgi:hypothetical protein